MDVRGYIGNFGSLGGYLGHFRYLGVIKHENQQAEILRATIMVVNLKKKERTVKGDQCDLAKDPPTIKPIFSLGYKERK